ncbi:TPA: decaprenyl-phosphate phosphoribosyltransferase [Candidatus Sumerlaeota bacterium]|jgi:4-hydroxybenzoate polyprenyltransferase|nr:decaprenyl-phosphate phosphoribosyltransferase [Candidatus Sumerlaeota bacterium]
MKPSTLYQLLRSLRPHQWTKNILLFAGLIFSMHFDMPGLFLRALEGFALFCMISGSIYVFNDLKDLEQDREHPRKKYRPLASGKVTPHQAIILASVLSTVGLVASFSLSVPFGYVTLTYFIITILYSQYFKYVVIVDILALALGFVLRAVAGVLVIRISEGPIIPMTPWFVICVFFLALFIAMCKRRHELLFIQKAELHRRVLAEYSQSFLDQMIAICTSGAIFSYVLYLLAISNHNGEQDLKMLLTLPFVLYGIFRYLYLVYRCEAGGEPDKEVLRDKPLLINTVLWLALSLALLKSPLILN